MSQPDINPGQQAFTEVNERISRMVDPALDVHPSGLELRGEEAAVQRDGNNTSPRWITVQFANEEGLYTSALLRPDGETHAVIAKSAPGKETKRLESTRPSIARSIAIRALDALDRARKRRKRLTSWHIRLIAWFW